MKSDIILIGPIGAGKTTIGKQLADFLHISQCSMDVHRWKYYKEIGYDEQFAAFLEEKGGFIAKLMYWKEFECYAVERILSDYSNCVFDLGGGHSVYEIGTQFKRVETALGQYKNVILLLPSGDMDESIRILNERKSTHEDYINEHFVRHPSNYKLAKHIVYTKNKTPLQTRDEILKIIS